MVPLSSPVEGVYRRLPGRVAIGRERLGRPLTLAEKVLFNHLRDPRQPEVERGLSYADFDPDRVALQDVLAQMVGLQFMTTALDETAVPTTLHCDHLIQARASAASDLDAARTSNAEVYEFLRAVSTRYGIEFWEPGSGIIHQVILENYAFPGGMMIGTDSHTPNGGGLGMVAIGVGGGDAIDAMTGSPFNLRWPRLIGVHLIGSLSGWSAPKDVILRIAELLTVTGGTGAIVEYFGPGADSISATGKATICNMGAEIGATTSVFPFDSHMADYLRATCRGEVADAATAIALELRCDWAVEADPGRFFDRVLEVDLSRLDPRVNGPDAPDLAHPVGAVGRWAIDHGVPTEISSALIGSCTNSSYEDISRAASIARQAAAHGLRTKSPLLVTPGSEQVRATTERDGLLRDLEAIGGTVLANACGPCIGQWERRGVTASQPNTILTSYNRNFPGRNDGSSTTKSFLASPEIVVALALAGTLEFNPLTDTLTTDSGDSVRLDPPTGAEVPAARFVRSQTAFQPRPPGPSETPVVISPTSDRLQRLDPFPAWDGRDYLALPVLVKAKGKCTTDQISAAGTWLNYRGHLENISANLFLGAINAFTGSVGSGRDPIDGQIKSLPDMAKHLSLAGVRWCAIGDENYGEGSSRELAAMEPRYRGGVAVLARSFARIHETNLKRHGVLPLAFVDPLTYDLIGEGDRISIHGLAALAPDQPLTCRITKPDGSVFEFQAAHTFSSAQIEWFRAGSALNLIRQRRRLTAVSEPVV